MTEFQRIKAVMKNRKASTKYFTKAFLEAYKTARAKTKSNFENLIDDSYMHENGYVKLFHSYDEVYNSKFYQQNSCGYCEFLEVANELNI